MLKETRILMGMPITVMVVDELVKKKNITEVFDYFSYIDSMFSTYKQDSEISQINRNEIRKEKYSRDMQTIFFLAEKTKQETNGYFDIRHNGYLDPSGVVKGWAILQAANLLRKKGFENYYVDAGGDVQVAGFKAKHAPWTVGIRNPFNREEIVKVVSLQDQGIATSGTYIRGQHVYNPHDPRRKLTDIVSTSVIGPDVCEADRFATAAFAMQEKGIHFIERLPGFEGYMIDKEGVATYTSGFEKYVSG